MTLQSQNRQFRPFNGGHFTLYFTYASGGRGDRSMTLQRPLSGPPPAEVPLPRAPLARVIAQVRFAPILAIRNPDTVTTFQEAIRQTYPILSEDRIHQIVLASAGTPDIREAVIWRFSDAEKRKWRASLGIDFLALETSAYVSRQDFLKRLGVILAALEKAFNPAEAQRLGLRYIDRLTGEAVNRIAELIRPKVLGILQPNKEPPNLGESVLHLLTEARLLAEEGLIQARWGRLPENATYDPDALEPVDTASWVLDLDMFSSGPQKFASNELLATATQFAERTYSIFREMVTDEFLKFYGGEL
jgi:uncharacterized protein (TIGR04255 family)